MWEKVVALVLQRKRMLGHFLESARPLGWQGDVLLLAVDPAHRGLIEHRDNRAPLVAALGEVYGRPLEVRCVDLDPSAPKAEAPAPSPERVVQNVQNVQNVPPVAPKDGPAPAEDPTAAATRKHPAELSPEARNTMLWLDAEIVPTRPNPPSRGPA
jgi:hypothetical protein